MDRCFFDKYDVTFIPDRLLSFGILNKAEIQEGVFDNIETMQNMMRHSKDFIFSITNQNTQSLTDVIVERAASGVKIKLVYPDRSSVPPEFEENKNIEVRVMKGVNFVATLTEREAGIVPPTTDGRTDYQKILFGTNKQFTDWVLSLFEYYYLRVGRG